MATTPYPTPETRPPFPTARGELSNAELPRSFAGDWLRAMPSRGHWVYLLKAGRPGRDPEVDGIEYVYVGVTDNLRARLRAHARRWWWPLIDPTLSEFERFVSRETAEAAEAEYIHTYQPAMNRAGRLLVVASR